VAEFLAGKLDQDRAARAATNARINSGVEPQQLPTNDAPASASAAKCEAKYSADVA
jgi:hypothetical protein